MHQFKTYLFLSHYSSFGQQNLFRPFVMFGCEVQMIIGHQMNSLGFCKLRCEPLRRILHPGSDPQQCHLWIFCVSLNTQSLRNTQIRQFIVSVLVENETCSEALHNYQEVYFKEENLYCCKIIPTSLIPLKTFLHFFLMCHIGAGSIQGFLRVVLTVLTFLCLKFVGCCNV